MISLTFWVFFKSCISCDGMKVSNRLVKMADAIQLSKPRKNVILTGVPGIIYPFLHNPQFVWLLGRNMISPFPTLYSCLLQDFTTWQNFGPDHRMSESCGQTKLKPIADGKYNISKGIISPFDRVVNTVGKGENTVGKKVIKSQDCVVKR